MTETELKKLPEETRVKLENSHKFYILAVISILLGTLTLVLGIFWAVFPYDPLVMKQEPVPVLSKQYNRGQSAQFKFEFCKTVNAEGEVERFLVSDDLEIRLPSYTEQLEKGCHDITSDVRIPDDGSVLVPGRYFVRFHVTYQLSPLKRTVVEDVRTEAFDIVQ